MTRTSMSTGTENRATFFRRIATLFPVLDPRYACIERAYCVAKDAFRNIHRDGGGRYFEHLRGVALILIDHLRIRDHRLIVAAMLHDIVEDIPSWSVERVAQEFDPGIACLVEWVTKPPTQLFTTKHDRDRMYHRRLMSAPRNAAILKLADRLHNVQTLWGCDSKKRLRKIEETRQWYLPLAEKHIILIHELETALAALEKETETI